jgi:hypothetical protein
MYMDDMNEFWIICEMIRLFNHELSLKHINVKTITLDKCQNVLEVEHYNNCQFKYCKHYSNEKVIFQM